MRTPSSRLGTLETKILERGSGQLCLTVHSHSAKEEDLMDRRPEPYNVPSRYALHSGDG